MATATVLDSSSSAPLEGVPRLTQQFLLRERWEELQHKIDDLAKKVGVTDLSKVRLVSNAKTNLHPAANAGFRGITVPDFYMIKPQDIPSDLRLKGFDDPKLQSDQYIDKLHHWLANFLGFQIKPGDKEQRNEIRCIAHLLSRPDKIQDAVDFVLCHEISHIHNDDIQTAIFYKVRNISLSVLAAAAIFAAIGFIAGLTTITAIVAILTASATQIAAFKVLNDLEAKEIGIPCEKKADLLAARITGPEGGIHYFEAARKYQLQLRNNPNLPPDEKERLQRKISSEGDSLTDIEHPPFTERIDYLRHFDAFV